MTLESSDINHYEANSDFHLLYSDIKDHFYELEAFLKHIHGFVSLAENKLGKDLKLYSADFFEYYYAGSYGETFRSSFIVTVCSVSEAYVKSYVATWKSIFKVDLENVKPTNGILDYLKTTDKDIFKIDLDFSKKEIQEFRALLNVRNAIVHSSGTLDYVLKYEAQIRQLSKAYPSLHVSDDGFIWTDQNFCNDSMKISQRFFFYIFKKAIKKFPDYLLHKTEDDF